LCSRRNYFVGKGIDACDRCGRVGTTAQLSIRPRLATESGTERGRIDSPIHHERQAGVRIKKKIAEAKRSTPWFQALRVRGAAIRIPTPIGLGRGGGSGYGRSM